MFVHEPHIFFNPSYIIENGYDMTVYEEGADLGQTFVMINSKNMYHINFLLCDTVCCKKTFVGNCQRIKKHREKTT